MRECHCEVHLRLAARRCPPPVEQYTRKADCRRTGQRQATRIEEHRLLLFPQRPGCMEACFTVLLDKGEEVLPTNAFDLSRLDRLCCHLISRSGDDRSQPENISRHGDLENQGSSFPRSAGKLDLTGANDEDAVARPILLKELRALRKRRLHADRLEVGERLCVKIAEHSQRAQLTGITMVHRSSFGKRKHSESA